MLLLSGEECAARGLGLEGDFDTPLWYQVDVLYGRIGARLTRHEKMITPDWIDAYNEFCEIRRKKEAGGYRLHQQDAYPIVSLPIPTAPTPITDLLDETITTPPARPRKQARRKMSKSVANIKADVVEFYDDTPRKIDI